MALCEATTKRGKACGAQALSGESFCFMHSPAQAGKRAAARRLGGARRGSHAGDMSSLPERIKTIGDVLGLLDYTRAELSALPNGIPRARALIALASSYLQALEVGEIEERLAALEERVNVSKK